MSALAPLVGMPVAFKLGTALGVFLLPLLVYASFRLMRLAVPRPAPGRRRRARLPLRRGQPDLGRHDREHADRRVLLHLRRRLRHPLPGRSLPGPRRRAGSLGPGRGAGADQLRARLRRAVGGPDGHGPSPVRSRRPTPPRRLAYARLAAGGRGAGLCASPAPPSCRSSRTGAGRRPSTTPGSTSRRTGSSRRSCGRSSLPARSRLAATLARRARGGRRRRAAPAARLRGALGRGARLGRAGPRRDRRALRPARAAVAGPGRGGRARPRARAPRPGRRGRARPRAGRRGARGRELALPAPLGRLELLRAGGEGAVAGLEGADAGARRRPRRPARGVRVRPRARARRLDPHARDGALLLRAARGSRVSTTSRASPRTPSTTCCRSCIPPRRTRSAAGPTPGSTSRPRSRGCACSRRSPGRGERRARFGARRACRRPARGAHPALHALPRDRHRGPATSSPWPSRPCAHRRPGGATRPSAGSRASRPTVPSSSSPTTRASTSWPPTPGRPRPSGRCRRESEVTEAFDAESIRITTSRPGHPLLVKVSYHPRWRAEGADGPYLASPGFMLIVPRQREVRLAYAARTGSDHAGLGLAVLAIGLAAASTRRRRRGGGGPRRAGRGAAAGRRPVGAPSCPRCPSRSSSGWPRCASFPSPRTPARSTRSTRVASRAYAEERWEDAAEYARHAVALLRVARPAAGRAALRPRRGAAACRSRAGGGRAVHARRRGRAGAAPAAGAALGRPRPRGGGRPGGCFGLAPPAPRGVPRNAVGAPSRAAGRPVPAPVTGLTAAPLRGATLVSRLRGGRNRGPVAVPPTGPPGKDDMRKAALVLRTARPPVARRRSRPRASPSTTAPSRCIVAGQYPRLNACFAPAVQPRPRPRLLPRVADAPPDWYYVEMASDSPCHAGILPRPKKELVGRRIQYYVDAFDRSFAESRTPEAEALVVSSASECRSEAAGGAVPQTARPSPSSRACPPASPPRPPPASGPGRPRPLAVGGAAVVGGGVAVGRRAGGSASAPTTTLPPWGSCPRRRCRRRPPPPPRWSPAFNPVFKVFDGPTLVPGDTIVGNEPLVLRFDMCDIDRHPTRCASRSRWTV